MTAAAKAKRHLLGIEIPRDELAFRIGCQCIGMIPPAGTNATEALASFDAVPGADGSMADGFRRAADAAVLYFHECIQAGRAPH